MARKKGGKGAKSKRPVKRRHAPVLTVRKGKTVRGRVFVQRYFIDKFKRGNKTEYEVWTVVSRGTPALKSKTQVITKLRGILK